MGKLIAVANQKGGVGKTTTAYIVACLLSSLGYKVLLKDADMQGSSTSWYESAESTLSEDEASPFDFEITNKASIGRRKERYDFVVVDTPPQNTVIMDAALAVADYVIIPTAPTSLDLERVFEILRVIEIPYKVLLTQIKSNTITYRSVQSLFDDQEIAYFKKGISHREALRQSIGTFVSEDAMRDYKDVVEEMLSDLGSELSL
ncbi:ParA family protein [Erysipelothrix anatis]|uniref:ParA family protein n=1 Tax=Erysipelothrix anatis TaxID=2683713 RepID=UPI00140ACF29|nr:ParA family protein [Erysipelothrix anatis]